MIQVCGLLGVSQSVATTVVSIVLTGSTIITIILALTALLSGGVDAILTIGWSTFVATVKKIAAQKGRQYAIAY